MMRVQRQKITGIVHECSIHFTNLSTRFFLFCFEKTNGHNVNCLVFIPDFLLEWMYSREFFLWPFSPRSILFTYQFSLVRFHDMLMADVIPVKTLIIYIFACVRACVRAWVSECLFSQICVISTPLSIHAHQDTNDSPKEWMFGLDNSVSEKDERINRILSFPDNSNVARSEIGNTDEKEMAGDTIWQRSWSYVMQIATVFIDLLLLQPAHFLTLTATSITSKVKVVGRKASTSISYILSSFTSSQYLAIYAAVFLVILLLFLASTTPAVSSVLLRCMPWATVIPTPVSPPTSTSLPTVTASCSSPMVNNIKGKKGNLSILGKFAKK